MSSTGVSFTNNTYFLVRASLCSLCIWKKQILQISLDMNFIYEKTTELNLKKMILIKIL
jgi:hypothetical protein